MDYSQFADFLSERLGIHKIIFSLDLENEKLEADGSGFNIYALHNLHTHYVTSYYYSQNENEGWKSITIDISSAVTKEVLSDIVDYLENNNINFQFRQETFELDCNDGNFNRVLGSKTNDGSYRLQIAKRD